MPIFYLSHMIQQDPYWDGFPRSIATHPSLSKFFPFIPTKSDMPNATIFPGGLEVGKKSVL